MEEIATDCLDAGQEKVYEMSIKSGVAGTSQEVSGSVRRGEDRGFADVMSSMSSKGIKILPWRDGEEAGSDGRLVGSDEVVKMGVVMSGAKKFLDGKSMDLMELKQKLIQTGELIDPKAMDTGHEKKVAFALAKYNLRVVPQHKLGKYVFDFKVVNYPILIEIDGNVHNMKKVREKDYRKDRMAQKLGFKVLRYSNRELSESTNNIVQEMRAVMKKTGKQPHELVIYKMSFIESLKLWWKKRREEQV